MAWTSTIDLLGDIHDARRRLIAGEATVDQAHAEARLLGTAAKILNIQLDHARLTCRLTEGSDVLPPVRFEVPSQKVPTP